MIVHVVGTCQAKSLAACLQVMIPDARIEQWPAATDLAAIAPDDIVFRQRDRPNMTPARHGGREIMCPIIWFNAFHPDVVYLVGPWGSVTPPLGGGQHSSLVLYGWHRGLTAAQTAKLFTEAVFEKLHFFDCWDAAKRTLFEECRDLGFPFEAAFARVERYGCFMHSPIHPALAVMAEVARDLVRLAGLTPAVAVPESYVEDPLLRGPVWAVYPEIATRLGLTGAYAFKATHAPGAPPALLDLDEFIARAFEAYAAAPPEALVCRRLEHASYRDLESVAAGERPSSPHVTAPLEWSRDFYIELPAAVQPRADAPMEPLAPASMRARLRTVLPAEMKARSVVTVTCTVHGDGDVALSSGGSHPVFLCYRWFDAAGNLTEIGRSIHTPLPDTLEPGAEVTLPMRIEAPRYPGRYRLRCALLQSEVAWFDDIEPDNGVEAVVDVFAKAMAAR